MIILCSKNEAKVLAAKNAISKKFDETYQLTCVETKSNVRPTPFGFQECITGAENRIACAQRIYPEAMLFIAAEGGIIEESGEKCIGGYVVTRNRIGRQFIGMSRFIRIPSNIAQYIQPEKSIQETMNYSLFPSHLAKDKDLIGLNGLITNNKYNRVREFEDAIGNALSGTFL